MKWEVRFDKHAMRALAGMDAVTRRRLQAGALVLSQNPLRPRPRADIKRLQDQPGFYRLRIGDYRLFYVAFPSERIIVVTDVRHRGHAYD